MNLNLTYISNVIIKIFEFIIQHYVGIDLNFTHRSCWLLSVHRTIMTAVLVCLQIWAFRFCIIWGVYGWWTIMLENIKKKENYYLQQKKSIRRYLLWIYKISWITYMVISFLQRRCHPVTRCIKKIADQPCYNVIFYLGKTEHKY